MNFTLKNKIIIVTGGTSGIGRNISLSLAAQGAKIALCYKENHTAAVSMIEELNSSRAEFIVESVDVKNPDAVSHFIKQVVAKFGRIDVLINNAGICDDNYVSIMRNSQWEEVIATNLNGTFYFTKFVSRFMIKQASGKIFNISSSRGIVGSYGQSNYAASKAGIIAFTKSVARELGKKNILVNAILPPFIRTNLNRDLNLMEKKELVAKNSSAIGAIGSQEVICNFIKFISSDLFFGVTGQIFSLDSRIES